MFLLLLLLLFLTKCFTNNKKTLVHERKKNCFIDKNEFQCLLLFYLLKLILLYNLDCSVRQRVCFVCSIWNRKYTDI
jgi:hypothetical protein